MSEIFKQNETPKEIEINLNLEKLEQEIRLKDFYTNLDDDKKKEVTNLFDKAFV
ncbi:MAG: hypothetical protein QM490_03865 [Candidatus Gracilibacteria bacterium]